MSAAFLVASAVGVSRMHDLLEMLLPAYMRFMIGREDVMAASEGKLGLHAFHSTEGLLRECAMYTVGFALLYPALDWACRRPYLAKWYASMEPKYKRDFLAYVVCTVHHFYIVPRSWYSIYSDVRRGGATADYSQLEASVSAIVIGYLVADTLLWVLPNRSMQYLAHHVLVLCIIWAGLQAPMYLMRYIPHLLVAETTPYLYNVAWLLRRGGFRNESVLLALELAFVLAFPFVRLLNMPVVFLVITENGLASHMGWVHWLFLPLSCLQFFWGYLVLLRVCRTLSTRDKKKRKE